MSLSMPHLTPMNKPLSKATAALALTPHAMPAAAPAPDAMPVPATVLEFAHVFMPLSVPMPLPRPKARVFVSNAVHKPMGPGTPAYLEGVLSC